MSEKKNIPLADKLKRAKQGIDLLEHVEWKDGFLDTVVFEVFLLKIRHG